MILKIENDHWYSHVLRAAVTVCYATCLVEEIGKDTFQRMLNPTAIWFGQIIRTIQLECDNFGQIDCQPHCFC